MAHNLLDESWLAVRRADGVSEWIAPWQMTLAIDSNPIIALDFPRPDFNAAAAQFLIGLVQTVLTPQDGEAWDELMARPPAPEALRARMDQERDAFALFGDGPRFMQDLELADAEYRAVNKTALFPASALLIDAPGENAQKLNTDHFVKRGGVETLCPACAAMALFTLQANAPSGGAGYRTSLRGGGPLTTLVLGRTLWETVCCNVLVAAQLAKLNCDRRKPRDGGIFPWLAPTVTSERKGTNTIPADVQPLHVYWSMPRRIRLVTTTGPETPCDVCGRSATTVIRNFWAKNYGYNYEGAWNHPLTPYTTNAKDERISLKGQPSGVRYRNWGGIVASRTDGKDNRTPALCVRAYEETIKDTDVQDLADDPTFRIWATGYDMDNMKARAWVESVVPVYMVPAASKETYEHWIGRFIDLAGEVAGTLRQQCKKALLPERAEIKTSTAMFAELDARFWAETEPGFYETIKYMRRDLTLTGDELKRAMQRQGMKWLGKLQVRTWLIFDHYARSGDFKAQDPERLSEVEGNLSRFLSIKRNSRLRTLLDLPVKESQKTKRKAKG